MKILALSDSHSSSIDELPSILFKDLQNIDLVVHCGDFTNYSILEFLTDNFPILAVRGNNDYQSKFKDIPYFNTINKGKHKISVTHGHLITENSLVYKYPDSDLIFCGHTHHPRHIVLNETHIINPGSILYNRYLPYNSYAIISINEQGIDVFFRKIDC